MKSTLLGVTAPQEQCTDKKCPFHGEIAIKPEYFRGYVIKVDTNRSATIQWFRPYFVTKYERYEIRRSKMRVHNPACIHARVGQEVLAARSRPLSKTKNHIIIQIIGEGKESPSATHILPDDVPDHEHTHGKAQKHKIKGDVEQ